jgi:formate-dependent nitrite reductase cytochrome c552 subunit
MKYLAAALAAAALAFLAASLLVRRESAPPAPGRGTLEQRFPQQAASYKQPAARDSRWKESRGHAFSLKDRDESDPEGDARWNLILEGRPEVRPVPAACLTCHATAESAHAATYYEARDRRPLGCADCHDPNTAELRLTRTAPRAPASYEDLKTLLCAQCHREYYIAAGQALFPEGRTPGEIEAFYERRGIVDWRHAGTGAVVLSVRHPQFEMHSQGPHARAGVGCADCHMPRERSGAVHITDHRAALPLDNAARACLPCHRESEDQARARAKEIQQRTSALLSRAEDALVEAIDAIEEAEATGERPDAALKLQTRAQWRISFVSADGSKGFHAPQEAARLLGEAIDYARQAQLEAVRRRRPLAQ